MEITDMLLTPNPYSRPQSKIGKINGVVIHYVANPGTSAQANRNYFENLKNTKERYASSHYIIGLNGEIIRCVPENEIAYHASQANQHYIGIECCHPDATGKFNDKTYASLVELAADILKRNNATEILRHYDITGKICPKYYVDNPDAWKNLQDSIMEKAYGRVDMMATEYILKVLAAKIKIDKDYWRKVLDNEEKINIEWLKILFLRLLGEEI